MTLGIFLDEASAENMLHARNRFSIPRSSGKGVVSRRDQLSLVAKFVHANSCEVFACSVNGQAAAWGRDLYFFTTTVSLLHLYS